MSIRTKVAADVLTARKAKDNATLVALGNLKTAITIAETDKNNPIDLGMGDAPLISVIQKLIKQRHESAEIYKKQNREDLYNIEMGEVKIYETYLPEQLSADVVRPIIERIVKETGASSIRDMGKVMNVAKDELGGQIDKQTLSEIVKSVLGI